MNNTLRASLHRVLNFWHWREQMIAMGLTIVIFTIMGPFSTFDMPFGIRLMYWALEIGIGWILVLICLTLFVRNPITDEWPVFARVGAAILAASLPIGLVVIQVEWIIRGNTLGPGIFIKVFFICALIGGVISLRIQSRLGITESISENSPPDFFKRLPYDVGTDLISLSMQDHYIEVTTAKGTELILMRLSDAIAELEGVAGVQIHRSHWVVKAAMRRTKREGGRLFLELIDGHQLPVSRTYAPSVKAALAG